jgi:2-oxoglutarate dehydrogenase E1 component
MSSNHYSECLASSFLNGANTAYIEELYDLYLKDQNSVPAEWRTYFAQAANPKEASLSPVRERFLSLAAQSSPVQAVGSTISDKQSQVNAFINAYRALGHYMAKTDPLGFAPLTLRAELELAYHGLSSADLNEVFDTNGLTTESKTLKEIIGILQAVYCGTLASEFMYISDVKVRQFVQAGIEKKQASLSADQKKKLLASLTAAEGWERYLATQFVGQKRFSLEGCDSLIPLMEKAVALAAQKGVKEMTIGMPHRGRLNVLINIMGKPPQEIFDHFAGKHAESAYSGDVKYHLGYSSDLKIENNSIHLSMAFNPSHLEIIAPIVEGSAYIKQQARGASGLNEVLPIIMHGDASVAGQGVVMEALNFSQLPGYKTGGTIHIVVNNQVGFTTDQNEARSTRYCTDIAKMFEVPVFHANADDPEAVVRAIELALEFRMQFKKDVFIELIGYRRFGHNEADEPMATQPVVYKHIKEMSTARTLYARKLIEVGQMTAEEEKNLQEEYRSRLAKGAAMIPVTSTPDNLWIDFLKGDMRAAVKTAVDKNRLIELGQKITNLPEGFVLQPQVDKVIKDRRSMIAGELALDWGCAETLAYASLLAEGYPVRISGQDAQRSTFAYRHAVLHDQNTNNTYMPLAHVDPKQASMNVYNSILSEEAVVAFEYGVAGSAPKQLTIWEAQYGDFANGAQNVIDQFIAAGEQKWQRLNGLTLFLPHGYEGAGPEHSSARLERFLQLCAQDNMFVCMPSTPAQAFHMIRRQVLQSVRKPLIVMMPKSVLRNKTAVSHLEELSHGNFQTLIPDILNTDSKKIKRLILCSGRVYYDLLQKRTELKRDDIALVRIEQLYPLPVQEIKAVLASYVHVKEIVFCQEEPKNMGPWPYLQACFLEHFPEVKIAYVGRSASASTAAGYGSDHAAQLQAFLIDAIDQ